MRIGILGTALSGPRSGATRRIENLALALARRGEEVVLYVSSRAPAALPSHPGIQIVPLPVPPRPAIARATAERFALPRRIAEDRIELLECSQLPVPPVEEVPFLLTIHDLRHLAFHRHSPFSRRLLAGPILREACRRASAVVAVSEFTKSEIVRLLGVEAERIAVVPNAADHLEPPPSVERERIVLYVGHLEPRKNLGVLLEAFARLRREGFPHRLRLVGLAKVGAGEELRDRAVSLGIAEAVEFRGPVEDSELTRLYASAELFVFPSRYEGFGIPLLEAMRCGAPALAARSSSLPEIGGEACAYASPDSPEEWTSEMARLLRSGEARAVLARRGRGREALYRWDSSAEAFLEAARRALK